MSKTLSEGPHPARRRHRTGTPPVDHLRRAADPTPLYFKLTTLLRDSIDSLQYAPGSRLPAERELARLYGVSRITVRQALDALAAAKIIRRTRGRTGGTFVRTPAATDATKVVGRFNVVVTPDRVHRIVVDAFDVRLANAEVGTALALPVSTQVRYIERRFLGTAGPVAFVRNFLPLVIGERLRERHLRRRTLYEALTRTLRLRIVEVRDEVEAVLADPQLAPRLALPVGAPLLSIRRLYIGRDDEPVNFTVLITRTDRYRVSVQLGDRRFE
jgi:GntR family transcriptional regulator